VRYLRSEAIVNMNEQLNGLRVVTVLRQSDTRNGDEHDPEKSLGAQKKRAEKFRSECEMSDEGTFEEKRTSGGKSLASRHGLLAAVETIENGGADVLLIPWRDRLDRDLDVRREVCRRVDAAGGVVWAIDKGRVTFSTAATKLTSTIEGAMDENFREVISEKVTEQKDGRTAAGRNPGRIARLGYRANAEGVLEVVPAEAEVVRRAWRMKADGETVNATREMTEAAGFPLTYPQAQTMLSERTATRYLGHTFFGDRITEGTHEPILTAREVERALAAVTPRNGKRAPSERVLARLGVLVCDKCGARLVVGRGGSGPDYRHPPNDECAEEHGTFAIEATWIEAEVVSATRRALLDVWGSSAAVVAAREAEVEKIEQKATRARHLYNETGDPDALVDAKQYASDLKAARRAVDDARAASGVRLNGAGTWDDLGREERRELISSVVERVEVSGVKDARPETGDNSGDTLTATERRNMRRTTIVLREAFDRRHAERVLDEVAEGVSEREEQRAAM
jgi:DNA invertase Pin-like site-specific DNA recombinase